jgi:hypothetical protein
LLYICVLLQGLKKQNIYVILCLETVTKTTQFGWGKRESTTLVKPFLIQDENP